MNGKSNPRVTISVIRYACIAWAGFQLVLPSFIILDSIKVRAIHLGFAVFIALAQLLESRKKPNLLMWIPLIGLAVFATLYIILDWEGIASRSGRPSILDVVIGSVAVIILIDTTRRKIGLGLPIVVLFFSCYVFFGPYLPDLLAFQGASISKYVTQTYLSSEGIFGIPLGVSASVVYLFVLLGAMLEKAGAGKFFIDVALSVFGRYTGGPAKAAVAASGVMGMMSGSSIANVVTTGTFTIPLMKKVGYEPKKAAAIEVAASTDGQLMPPIMGAAAFIIAEYVNIPYIQVAKAAIIPALASNIALLYITHLEAIKSGIKGLAKADVPNLFKTLKGGVHFFIPIIAMFYELFVLRRSAEVAAFWTIMLLIAIIFTSSIRKGMVDRTPVKEILKGAGGVILEGFVAGSKNMVPVALACASAGIIVGLVNLGIGGMITQIVETMSGGNFVLLLVITAFASLILGMGLPTTATYIVMASLTAPIIVELAGNHNVVVPLLSAHLFCFYFGILADDTPPVGLASFAAAAIAKSPPVATCIQAFKYDVRTAIIPFMFMFNTNILLFGITSWGVACLILVMTALGACAFASAVQGWCFGRNGMWDTFLLLLATLIFFNPHWFASIGAQFLDIHAYFYYLVGIGLVAWLYFTQTRRDLANAV